MNNQPTTSNNQQTPNAQRPTVGGQVGLWGEIDWRASRPAAGDGAVERTWNGSTLPEPLFDVGLV